ncbi:MAG TPA: LuxR C-terminal-related transcriptional regulator [Hyphomicrobium sp.]|nr:LuxR C-terminal-related transcriptional regulator [Hyphomicrobium sp.]
MTDARLYSSISTLRNDHHKERNHVADIATQPVAGPAYAGTPLWNLTPQQWRVFLLVGRALSNKAIAHELRVAESTVKAHVSAIFKMAGCRNRTEAALLSQRVRYGLLEEDDAASLAFAGIAGTGRK